MFSGKEKNCFFLIFAVRTSVCAYSQLLLLRTISGLRFSGAGHPGEYGREMKG